MSNKQTAVEWLYRKIVRENTPVLKFPDCLEQAKQIEKEQQKQMFDCGRQYQLTGEGTFTQIQEELYGK